MTTVSSALTMVDRLSAKLKLLDARCVRCGMSLPFHLATGRCNTGLTDVASRWTPSVVGGWSCYICQAVAAGVGSGRPDLPHVCPRHYPGNYLYVGPDNPPMDYAGLQAAIDRARQPTPDTYGDHDDASPPPVLARGIRLREEER